MLSLIAFAALMPLLARIFLRAPAAAFAGFFLLFAMFYRSVDILYVDLFGPLYASELGRYVGGNAAAPMFYYGVASFAIPLLWVFRDQARAIQALRSRPAWQDYQIKLSSLAFLGTSAFVALLFGNLIRVGVVPLFAGMDRLQYNEIAGIVHNGAYELNFLTCFTLGAFTILPRINGREHDFRFVLVFVVLLIYWVLTGNRFSIFYTQFSFFFMPFAAVSIGKTLGVVGPLPKNAMVHRIFASKVFRFVAALVIMFSLAGLVVNSYYNVRNYRDPVEQIQERILLQPVQMWSAEWERVRFDNPLPLVSREAFDQIFINPIDRDRNTTIQYLMSLELGYFRSAELARMGQQYNGGYPEVHFELFNPWLALITLPLFGLATALMLRYTVLLLYRNMVVSAIAATYVFYGFSLHYAGGFLLFPLFVTYWLKIAALLLAIAWERQFTRRPPPAESGPAFARRPLTGARA
ncbi:DUF6418 domain-containing protein [Sphingomonas sp.]|jgi:hypothetical protein|uniref:DUF6418 domain-containing protein n=1 Tax=Sphingomonas sp. TaxID=28214 RepID=UPI002DEED36D|nr:DUF6418 domain-containing protein [Sphingomonas sp.]